MDAPPAKVRKRPFRPRPGARKRRNTNADGTPRRPTAPPPCMMRGPRYKHGTFKVTGPSTLHEGETCTYTVSTRLKRSDMRPTATATTHRRIRTAAFLPLQDLVDNDIMNRYVATPSEPLPRTFDQALERGTHRVYIQNDVVSITFIAEGIPDGPLDLHAIALRLMGCSVNCRSFSAIHVIMGDHQNIERVTCIDPRDVIHGGTPMTAGCKYVMKACTTIMMFSTREMVATGNNCPTAIHTDVHAFTDRMQTLLREMYGNPAVRAYPSDFSIQNCVASAYVGGATDLVALCAGRSVSTTYNETFPNALISMRYTNPDMPVFDRYHVRDFMRNGELCVKVILSLHGCALITGAPHPIAVAWVWQHMHAMLQKYIVRGDGVGGHKPKNLKRRNFMEEIDALTNLGQEEGDDPPPTASDRNIVLENFVMHGSGGGPAAAYHPLFS